MRLTPNRDASDSSFSRSPTRNAPLTMSSRRVANTASAVFPVPSSNFRSAFKVGSRVLLYSVYPLYTASRARQGPEQRCRGGEIQTRTMRRAGRLRPELGDLDHGLLQASTARRDSDRRAPMELSSGVISTNQCNYGLAADASRAPSRQDRSRGSAADRARTRPAIRHLAAELRR